MTKGIASQQSVKPPAPALAEWPAVVQSLTKDANYRKPVEQLVESLPFGVALAGMEGKLLASNARFEELAGLKAPESWKLLFRGEERKMIEAVCCGTAARACFSKKSRKADGPAFRQQWHAWRVSPENFVLIVEKHGAIEGVPLSLEEAQRMMAIQAQKLEKIHGELAGMRKALQAVKVEKDLIASALNGVEDRIVVVDEDGHILASNQAWGALSREWAPRLSRGVSADAEVGGDYLALLRSVLGEVDGETDGEKSGLLRGIRSVLEGTLVEFRHEIALSQASKRLWFEFHAVRLSRSGKGTVLIAHRDVSERKKAEQDIRESHALFRHVIEATHDGIFIYDTEGRFALCNSAYAKALGFNAAQIIGKSLFEVFKPDLAQTAQEQNLLVLTTGQTLNFELLLDSPQGVRNILMSKEVYRNHRGEVVGIFGIARDISNRKQVEKALQKSERHFRALIENSADRVGLLAADGTIRYASPSTKRILGFDIHELLGTNIFLSVHLEDRPEFVSRFNELLELPGASITLQYRALCKGGRWQWMEAIATNLLADPSVRAIVFNERDISERKEAELELMRFAEIVESSNDAIIGADPEGNITSWNSAAERIFGYSKAEALGKSMEMLVSSDRQKEYNELRAAALKGKGADDVETVQVAKDGTRIDVSLTLSPIRDRDRRIIGFSKIARDITERRRLEKEILEISDREKQRLGQDLHDDLCQHLVGISLVGNLLYQELAQFNLKQAEEARQITHLIRQAVEQARSLARGLSPLHLAGSGFMAGMEMLVFDTEQLFRIPCRFECHSAVGLKDDGVAVHLYRITQEALHNAVKHSQGSQVVVSLEAVENAVIVTVSDNGVGFAGQPAALDGAKSGGFGMHTMQYRARIIGANLEFKRNPEGGTTVVCRLPNRRGRLR